MAAITAKRIVCFSNGIASALVAVEEVRRHGAENVILMNHGINPWTEDPDIKRFGDEVADYLGIEVTRVNIDGIEDHEKIPDQFDVCVTAKAFKVGTGTELCSNRLKTGPFHAWLEKNAHPSNGGAICSYGFEPHETKRMERRTRILGGMGYQTSFPMAENHRTIHNIEEIGIKPPKTYAEGWKHGNCKGCLKAGKQHWYKVYCEHPDIWDKAKWAERMIGYTILKVSLLSLEPLFAAMKAAGVPPTEATPSGKFWSDARRAVQSRKLPMLEFDAPDVSLCGSCSGDSLL